MIKHVFEDICLCIIFYKENTEIDIEDYINYTELTNKSFIAASLFLFS